MNMTLVPRAAFACLALALLVLLMLPMVQYAATAPGELEACVNPGNGGMRLVGAAEACHNNETRVTWNITGPAGPAGQRDLQDRQDRRGLLQLVHHTSGSVPRRIVRYPAVVPEMMFMFLTVVPLPRISRLISSTKMATI
jgi:hypothetical protein